MVLKGDGSGSVKKVQQNALKKAGIFVVGNPTGQNLTVQFPVNNSEGGAEPLTLVLIEQTPLSED